MNDIRKKYKEEQGKIRLNSKEEIWKDIPYCEGYQISNLVNIWSLPKKGFGGHNGKALKQHNMKNGYKYANIYHNGKKKHLLVHRLMGAAFLGLDLFDTNMLVCHKNDIKDDNRLENLFIGTMSDNMKDMYNKGRDRNVFKLNHPSKGKFGKDNRSSKQVLQYTKEGNFIQEWGSITDAERNIKGSHVSSCCKGKYKQSGGFIWKYK